MSDGGYYMFNGYIMSGYFMFNVKFILKICVFG